MKSIECRYNSYGERLRFDGFRVFRGPEEEYLFRRIGSRDLLRLFESALVYAMLERKFLEQVTGQKLDREAFKELNEMRRTISIKNIANFCQTHDKEAGSYSDGFEFNFLTEQEMMEHIQANYRGQQIADCIAKLHKAKKRE